MTTLLNEVLNFHVPDTWSPGGYGGVRYRSEQVLAYTQEYNDVLQQFPLDLKNKVVSVHRVQNPYMYGRYRLRIEQLQNRGQDVYEEKWYHPIDQLNKVDVMEYNCDYRRYSSANGYQYDNKRPKFYNQPQRAVELFRTARNTSAMSLVMVRVSSTTGYGYSSSSSNTCTKDWDTEYYPDYIIDLQY